MLLDQLRETTRDLHQDLETLNGLPRTETDYVAQLAAFYGFVAPWEHAVAITLPADDVIRAGREKTAWLEADLAVWGVDAGALPRCERLPSTATRLEILGAAYVLEGSTLGGQMISHHLARTFGPRPAGYRYFQSYGAEVGARWQAFRAELVRCSSPEADPVLLAAARVTFQSLYTWFKMARRDAGRRCAVAAVRPAGALAATETTRS